MVRALAKRWCYRILVAQGVLVARADLAAQSDTLRPCDGVVVRHVDIETGRPTFRGALGWWRKAARAIGLHHQTTAEGLVRRFVSLDPGLACTEFRRSESERILRAQPFLADATVTTRRDGDQALVDVRTVDEVPIVIGGRFRGRSVQALNLGTLNLLGAGMHIEGRWEDGRTYRDGFGGKLSHQQLFGHPYAIMVEGARRPLGEYLDIGLYHPFYTDLQRIAWHAGSSISKDFARLRRPDRTELLQPVDRAIWNLGGVLRFGPRRKLGLIGGTIIGERLVPRHEFSLVDSLTGHAFPTTDTAGVRRYPTYDATSVAGVLGVRALRYSRMRMLDALAAEQDVATGAQVAGMLGVQPWARVPFRESFASLDAYVGSRWGRSFIGARVSGETRLDLERSNWEHAIASGRAAWYFQATPRWTSELSVEGAGGWRTILPFQLELGDRRGGLRGYIRSLEAGGHRLLGRLEQRVDLARYQRDRAAIGAGAFIEAGRIYAGDVPFGVTTPVRTSLGAALIAAVPARSQRTVRGEVAFPLSQGRGARPELRFIVREPMRGLWFEPQRVRWARLSAVPEQIFRWP
jgi:hypothetical protein